MSGDVLRWGILSTANIGVRKVIPATQKAERCEVVAIASRDGARAEQAAGELGIPRAHGSYEALLADPDVDAVYIPLPEPPARGVDDRGRPGRQARPVREAARDDRRRGRGDGARPAPPRASC